MEGGEIKLNKIEQVISASLGDHMTTSETIYKIFCEIDRVDDPLVKAAIFFPFLRAVIRLNCGQGILGSHDLSYILDILQTLPDVPAVIKEAKRLFLAEMPPLIDQIEEKTLQDQKVIHKITRPAELKWVEEEANRYRQKALSLIEANGGGIGISLGIGFVKFPEEILREKLAAKP